MPTTGGRVAAVAGTACVPTEHPMMRHTQSRPAAPDLRPEPQADPLAEEQLDRLARLIAVDEAPEPEALPPHQRQLLVATVRRIRTDRLMDLIARCVALELKRGGGP
jgi:hypothetical protein